jgi:predicted DNA-binding transcriptional regulator AlpA
MQNPELHAALTGRRRAPKPTASTPQIAPALLDAKAGASLLSVSLRKFHQLRDELPKPVRLSARVVRWRRSELLSYVENLAVAGERQDEPPQLAAGKARKHARTPKAGDRPGALSADSGAPTAETHAGRGVRLPMQQSNPGREGLPLAKGTV